MKEWEYNQGMTSDSARTPDGNQVYQTTTDEYYEEWVEWDSPQGTTSGSVRIPVGQNSSVPTNAGVSVVIQSYSVITLETGTPIQHNTSNPSPLWGQPSYSTSLRNQSVGAPTKISYATPSYTPATSASGLSPPFVSLSSSTPIATTPILTPPVETQHPAPATSQFVTSVVHTHVYKTTAQSGSTWVVTHTVPLYTTICPVTETQTPEEIIPAPSSFVPMQTSQSNQPTSTPIQFIPAPSSPVQSAPSSWYAPNTPAPVPNIQTSGPVIHSDGTSTGANVVTKTFSVWTTICSEVECNTPPVSPPASNVSIVSPTGLVTGTKGVSTDASFVNSKTVAHTPGASQGTAQPLPNMITSIIYSTATRTITVGGSTQIVTSSVPAFTTTYPATETGNHPGATGIGSTTVTPTGSSSSGDNGFTGDSSPKPTAPLSNGATSTYGVVGFWTAVLAVAAYMV
ncbi:hypothetical protein KEM54_000301 [Ascosphaera aggregata]|nr:hypothetical protein KEM54_000301 [Ascosphaera aggregata]